MSNTLAVGSGVFCNVAKVCAHLVLRILKRAPQVVRILNRIHAKNTKKPSKKTFSVRIVVAIKLFGESREITKSFIATTILTKKNFLEGFFVFFA